MRWLVCLALMLPSLAHARTPVPQTEFFDEAPTPPTQGTLPEPPPCILPPRQPTLAEWQAKNDMETGIRMMLVGGGGLALLVAGTVGAVTRFGAGPDSTAPRIVGATMAAVGGIVAAILFAAGLPLYQKGHRAWPDHPRLELTLVPDGGGGGNLALSF